MEQVIATGTTVLKVLIAATSGSVVAVFVPGGLQSIKDLNFISSNVFAPAFTFANLITTFTLDLVLHAYLVMATAFICLATGLVAGYITAKYCCSSHIWISDLEEERRIRRAKREAAGERVETAHRSILTIAKTAFYDCMNKPSPQDYFGLYIASSALQNTGTFPIALLQSLIGSVPWFGQPEFEEALAVIFGYQSINAVFLWSLGMRVLDNTAKARAKHLEDKESEKSHALEVSMQRLMREEKRAHSDAKTLHRAIPLDPPTETSLDHRLKETEAYKDSQTSYTSHLTRDEPHGDLSKAQNFLPLDHPSSAQPESDPSFGIANTGEDSSYLDTNVVPNNSIYTYTSSYDSGSDGDNCEPVQQMILGTYDSWFPLSKFVKNASNSVYMNLPLLSAIFGMICAIIPPVRWVFLSPLSVLIGGMTLVGNGSIPLSLVILGANLSISGLGPLKRTDKRFVVVCTVMRLLIIPIMNLIIYYIWGLLGLLPPSRVLRLTIWVEMVCPTAINLSVICQLNNVLPSEASALLLVQYVCAVFSTALWLSLFLLLGA